MSTIVKYVYNEKRYGTNNWYMCHVVIVRNDGELLGVLPVEHAQRCQFVYTAVKL